MGFNRAHLTNDLFLGGLLQVWQPHAGYRAGIDPVLLAASVAASPGQKVLELGCGAGVASLCLARRVHGLKLTGVELQDDYARLARRNATENGIDMQVVTADISDLPAALRQQRFDHVFANPPYFQGNCGTPAADAGRNTALTGDTSLDVWVDVATRRLRPGGHLTFIQKGDRLGDLLTAFDKRLGSVRIKPLAARTGRAAQLVIVVARKGGRGALRLLAPLIVHHGARHERDGESFSGIAKGILRDGDPLKMG